MNIANCISESGDEYLFKCSSSIPKDEFIQKIKTYATWEIVDDPDLGKTSYLGIVDISNIDEIPDVTDVIPDYSIKSL